MKTSSHPHPFFASLFVAGLIALTVHLSAADAPNGGSEVSLSSLDLSKIEQAYGSPQADKSLNGNPLTINGTVYAKGVGTHALSLWYLDLKKGSDHFHAVVGIDDDEKGSRDAAVKFVVEGDGRQLWESPILHAGQSAVPVDLDVKGLNILVLKAREGVEGNTDDHADWADARLAVTGAAPQSVPVQPNLFSEILTPKSPPEPRIHGATVFGVRPKSPVLYAIAATGTRPVTFSVDNLPAGLSLDAATGRITGTLPTAGTYPLTLHAANALGHAERKLTIIVGDTISLTPPLGWNSWNCWGTNVDQQKVLQAAKAFISSGLAQHGWTYINIDDGWQGKRGGSFNGLQPNEKFPDIKNLIDQIHDLGLRSGIYSTPFKRSYGGKVGGSADNADGTITNTDGIGQYVMASQDAQQWSAWGFDYLKYDWNIGVPETQRMSDALKAQGRDIVYSLSNAANFNDAKALAALANSWRTTNDIRDNWASMSGIGFSQDQWAPYASPGHFNDPDMLVVGLTGGYAGAPRPTQLTADEQYTHISLWSLLSAPLLIGCDLDKLDDFTLNLLTNDEVIDIDQDAAVKQATCVHSADGVKIYRKVLEDGSLAVGLFNVGPAPQTLSVQWADLGLQGKQTVRDVWRQKDLGVFDGAFSAPVHSHGVVLIRISPPKS